MRYLIAALALAGVAVASLALQVHYSTGTEPCSINTRWDCGIVNHSSYAVIDHVPVALIGILGYLAMAGLAFFRRRGFLIVASVLGMAFALHLTFIEKNVLQIWCLYCVISQGIIALITLLSIVWLVIAMRTKSRARMTA
ncbi:MAG TPA: vitamin K epoxide reductase family protein [Terracidiphilus sp.]|nr:vitamin K epoxide reductase family protein [Terracidiphilus sp.]